MAGQSPRYRVIAQSRTRCNFSAMIAKSRCVAFKSSRSDSNPPHSVVRGTYMDKNSDACSVSASESEKGESEDQSPVVW